MNNNPTITTDVGTRCHMRWLRLLAAVLMALVGFSPALADTTYYRDKKGITITAHGSGQFTMDYLTYDYYLEDDWLEYLDIYIVCNGKSELFYKHSGAWDDGGYGEAKFKHSDYTFTDEVKRSNNHNRFRAWKVTVPQRLWGDFAIRVVGKYHYKGTDAGYEFDYTTDSYSLGAKRFTNSPSISSVNLTSPTQVTVTMSNLPVIGGATNKVYIKSSSGSEVSYTISSASQSFVYNLPSGTDITNAIKMSAYASVSYAYEDKSSTVDRSTTAFAKASNAKASYNTQNREVTVTWSATNASNADYVSVFRRVGSGSWTTVGSKLGKSTTSVTDKAANNTGLSARTTYEYKVVYGRSSWSDATGNSSWNGTASTSVTTTNKIDLNLSASRVEGGVKLSWNITHNSLFTGNEIEIYRKKEGESSYTRITTVSYANNGVGSYTNTGITGRYYYYIVLKSSGTWYGENFTSGTVEGLTIDATSITAFRASKGEYAGRVHLEWDVKNYASPSTHNYYRTTYNVMRKSLEDENSNYTKLSTFASTEDYVQYDDDTALPGIYYEYKIDYTTTANDDVTTKNGTISEVGFATASGKVMGSITYGTGTAVPGVDVIAVRNSSGHDMSSTRALEFNGTGMVHVNVSNEYYQTIFDDDFTIQMWMKPRAAASGTIYKPFRAYNDSHYLALVAQEDGTFSLQYKKSTATLSNIITKIPAGVYSHLTFARDGNNIYAYVYVPNDDGMTLLSASKTISSATPTTDWMEIGRDFVGNIDEYRVWTKALTREEAADNYNRSLVGNESGLGMYYRMDEGLKTQIFDCSRQGTTQNGHHGLLDDGVNSTIDVPSVEQLGYRGKTDENGNFIIEGIPFGGEGTSYSIIPTMGIHEFSPQRQMRYIGPSSLVHNSTDFTDVSSFPVSGVVYYENTLYPVEGCNLCVDGQICSRDGELVVTKADGSFEIDVPIGDHHIEVRKLNHTFAAAGRYPEDANKVGLKHTFNQRVYGLTFYDNTLVNLSGRIVGGSIEGDKPLGFGLSENNIGQVELVLQPVDDRYSLNVLKKTNEGVVSYDNNADQLACASATSTINSTAWRGAGNDSKKIFVSTDKATGEFSLMVPPLRYKVLSAKNKNGTSMIDEEAGVSEIDLTNPGYVEKDSVETEGGLSRYECNNRLMLTYHTPPVLSVQDLGAEEGAFGERAYRFEDDYGTGLVDNIYTTDDNGNATYRFGAPVFVSRNPYTFLIKGYEEYVNVDKDKDHPTRVSRVPLEGVVVNIANDLSATQPVYTEGAQAGQVADREDLVVALNERGEARYRWQGGLPNISESNQPDVPNYTRTISMSYNIGNRSYQWSGSGMHCILLGELSTGSNFVTAGPDIPDMVLRDPPGTNSYAEWSKGSVKTSTKVSGAVIDSETEASLTVHFGEKIETASGVGVLVMSTFENVADVIAGIKVTDEEVRDTIATKTLTTTSTIATSDAPEYVGAQGDVYIGSSTNLIFGMARKVGFTRESATAEPEITKRDVLATGVTFTTMFNYTQNYIENTLIPNWQKLLEQKLVYADEATINSFKNTSSEVVYRTKYRPTDEEFATQGSYKMFCPVGSTENFTDSVAWIINQIENWENIMAMNEEDKVQAYYKQKDKCLIRNVSFDSGTNVSYSEENEASTNYVFDKTVKGIAVVGANGGFMANKVGLEFAVHTESGGGTHEGTENEYGESASFSYTLAEEGDDDALTVDVLKSTMGWSPIFHTRGGQTCGPYEGEERTKYYEPGMYVLSEATMQIEVPKIAVDVAVMSDVPTGSAANFTLRLTNESEIDEDVYYKLLVADETNPHGAALTIDGVPFAEGRRVKVPAGQTVTKLLQLRQSDISVLDYENIAIVLGSETQFDPTSTWDVIADTCYIAAHFVPSSSEVVMHIDAPTVNTSTGTVLNLNFDSFDRNFAGLKAFRVQYRTKGDNNWNNVQEYVLNQNDKTQNNTLLPDGAKVALLVDMKDYVDGEYTFRVLSVATYGGSEVSRASNEIVVVKDMARPQLISIPSPTDGILNAGDEISVVFNEDIRQGYVTDAANFMVRGRLNGAAVSHDGVFQSQGGNGAQTQASIDLAGRDFAIGQWVKWTKAGSVVHHGTANTNLDIAISDAGKLKVTIAGQAYTSANTIPQGKWCYLNVAYDTNSGDPRLTADVASDASSVNLFNRTKVNAYEGNGALTIGKGITAAIHEVTLWNYARGFYPNEANVTRSASTDGLIGYWRLDEGHGNVGEDKARSRHLTMPEGNNWSMETENFALQLDGKSYASLDMSKTGSDADQNYALELWFRGDKQSADATLFSTVNDGLELMVTSSGLTLNVAGQHTALSAKDYMDNTWHHFALNVLKGTSGMAAAYVDGNLVAQMNAANLPAVQTDKLTLGARRTHVSGANYTYSQYFKGAIDEVRFWNGTQSAASLRANIYNKVATDAPALAAYYPFEKVGVDQFNQPVTSASLADQSQTAAADAKVTGATTWSTKESPALKNAPALENVPFSFVASERKLLINLEAEQQRIEGCNLQFTVRGVQDMNGNYSNDINWAAFVKQNQLEWAESQVKVVKEGTDETTFDVDIINASGQTADWNLTALPMWLTVDNEAGSLLPLSQKTLHFTVAAGTAIGRYEAVIGLSGTNGVTSNLGVNLVVTGERPDWAVNPADFENTMNVVAQLMVDGQLSEDPEDIVAAFIDGECRGVAQPVYFARYDAYYVMLNIYGNVGEDGKALVFKAFDASVGEVYPEVTLSCGHINYAADLVKGSTADPVVMTTTNSREQNQLLAKGWNWMSIYVEPSDKSVNNILASLGDKGSVAKNKADFANYTTTWEGSLATMECGKMYKVLMKYDATFNLIGNLVKSTDSPITVAKGWNWIGYNSNGYMSLDEAFADLNPADGDVVKSRGQFAMYMGYEWVGSLTALQPGQGYVYMSNASGTKTFRYPAAASRRMPQRTALKKAPSKYEPCDEHKYQGNMTMVAQAWKNDKPVQCEIAVFDENGECRGANTSQGEQNLTFLTIQGEGSGDRLNFRVVFTLDGEEQDVQACETYIYVNDAMAGSPAQPFYIDLGGNTNAIHTLDADRDVDTGYNLQGIRVADTYRGVKISNGKKVLKQ